MYEKLFVFGDSWGYGEELDLPREKPFGFWLGESLGCRYENVSQSGASLGLVTQRLIYKVPEISNKDLVVIIIPSDVRWYDQSDKEGWFPLYVSEPRYYPFLQDKTIEWFEYHHILFLYSIHKVLEDIGCEYVLAHNYGQLPDFSKFNLKFNSTKFLNKQSLTTLLNGRDSQWNTYQLDDDEPPLTAFSGKYFEGKICHPNESGHKKIAELIFNKIKEDFK